MSKAEATKDTIVRTALKLFNQQGSTNVTTNHIATAAGISPGNLYYHFANKEAIICAIYARQQNLLKSYWATSPAPTWQNLRDLLFRLQFLYWDYRFLSLESNVLLANNPDLKRDYIAGEKYQQGQVGDFLAMLRLEGVLDVSEEQLKSLLEMFYLVGSQYIASLAGRGKAINRLTTRDGILLIESLIKPYIKEN